MVKLPTLKKVVLPNNRTFYAKFRKVTRDTLKIRRARRRCSLRAQRGCSIKTVLRAGFKLVKKSAMSKIGRHFGKSAIENAPRA